MRIASSFPVMIVAVASLWSEVGAADAAAVNGPDPDLLAKAVNAVYRADGKRDDAGKFDGVITFMETSNGRIREVRGFAHGMAEGLYAAYDGNGQLREEGKTHAGKAVGLWVIYDGKGVVVAGVDCDKPGHPGVAAGVAAAATRAAPAGRGDGE